MGIRVNLTDVGTGFDPIPAGKYRFKVTDGSLETSGEQAKNPGAQYIKWELTVSEGDFEGRKLFLNTSLLPQALFGLKGLLAATGSWTEEELNQDLDFEIADVLGEEVGAIVAQKEYQGDTVNNIKRCIPVDKVTSSSGASSLLP
jgi:hypothetical protein